MPVNSISPKQSAQASQVSKTAETTAARKQSDIKESNKIEDRKDAAERKSQIQNQQLQKAQEQSKPVVNTSGQKTGTLINTAA